MSGQVLVIPRALALDKQFTARAIRLWLFLQATARHKDDEGNLVCIRDRAEIADELGFSYIMVSNTLLSLQNAGWVKIDRIPGSHSRQMTIYETPQVQAA